MTTVLQYLVIAAVVGLLLFGVALLLFGRGERLAALPARTSPARLPERGIAGSDVRQVRFALAVRGYRMSDVDWTLERLADELDRTRHQLALLTPGTADPDAPGTGQTGTEQTGTEHTGVDQVGTEHTSTAQTGAEDTGVEQVGTEHTGIAQPGTDRLDTEQHDTQRHDTTPSSTGPATVGTVNVGTTTVGTTTGGTATAGTANDDPADPERPRHAPPTDPSSRTVPSPGTEV